MRARLQLLLYRLRGSYWFIPAMMAILAIFLSHVSVQLDRRYDDQWVAAIPGLVPNQPDGARALLATVAGSMITVAGVTFSLTILAVSYATSHFGPRLLDNFMQDRGNQVTLGMFVATFLYCLMVLRTVHSNPESLDADVATSVFVPHLSVYLAVGLTLASVGVLIYFIHHVPESINIANVLDDIGTQISQKIDDLYPDMLGTPDSQASVDVESAMTNAIHVASHRSGYLQGVEDNELFEVAGKYDLVVELLVRPGEYLLAGQNVANVVARGDTAIDDVQIEKLQDVFAIGTSRTPTQDLHFLTNQYVEIAVRALSPGVNDPFTANQCIDQLTSALRQLSTRSLPSRFRQDPDGVTRVITTETTWNQIVEQALVQLIPYVKTDTNVARHLRMRIHQLLGVSDNDPLNDLLRDIDKQLVREASDT